MFQLFLPLKVNGVQNYTEAIFLDTKTLRHLFLNIFLCVWQNKGSQSGLELFLDELSLYYSSLAHYFWYAEQSHWVLLLKPISKMQVFRGFLKCWMLWMCFTEEN